MANDACICKIAEGFGSGIPALRTVAAPGSLPKGTRVAGYEDVAAIIKANKDLITVRECRCGTQEGRCDHRRDLRLGFGRWAEDDLSHENGRKISCEEALCLADEACSSGLLATVGNVARIEPLEFMYFCCGCRCRSVDPASHGKGSPKTPAPSRFLAVIDEDACWGCEACEERCPLGAIEIEEFSAARKARVNEGRCLGCGVCVTVCPEDEGIYMKEARPADYIPGRFGEKSPDLHA